MPASKALGPVWATIVTRTWIDETSSGRTPPGSASDTCVSIVLVAAPTGIDCVSAFATPARFAGSPFTETPIGYTITSIVADPISDDGRERVSDRRRADDEWVHRQRL